MESQIAFTFASAVDGRYPSNSVSSMVLHILNGCSENHMFAAIVLLRDHLTEGIQKMEGEKTNEMFELITDDFVEEFEEMIALFKKHPTRPVFNEWLRQRGMEV